MSIQNWIYIVAALIALILLGTYVAAAEEGDFDAHSAQLGEQDSHESESVLENERRSSCEIMWDVDRNWQWINDTAAGG